MKKEKLIISLCTVVLSLFSLNRISAQVFSQAHLNEVRKIIETNNASYFRSFAKNDVAGFKNLYQKTYFRTKKYFFIMIKKNILGFLQAVLIVTAAFSCNTRTEIKGKNLDDAKKAIAESNAIYFESFVKNDSSIFINRYAEDACIMAPFAPQFCGRGNAAKFFRTAYDVPQLSTLNLIFSEIFSINNGYGRAIFNSTRSPGPRR